MISVMICANRTTKKNKVICPLRPPRNKKNGEFLSKPFLFSFEIWNLNKSNEIRLADEQEIYILYMQL